MDILLIDMQAPSVCAACGGACCKQMPGGTHPNDWGAPNVEEMQRRIAAALDSGRYAIDWWEGDPRGLERGDLGYVDQGFYIRPATKGKEGRVYDASWGGECTFLAANGCTLEHSVRPLECRTLEPRYPMRCEQHHGKHATAIAWVEYHTLLEDVIRGEVEAND